MYEVEFSDEALADLNWFRKYDRNEILEGIDANLRYEPTKETLNRKRLHPNGLAEWELRIGKFRVY